MSWLSFRWNRPEEAVRISPKGEVPQVFFSESDRIEWHYMNMICPSGSCVLSRLTRCTIGANNAKHAEHHIGAGSSLTSAATSVDMYGSEVYIVDRRGLSDRLSHFISVNCHINRSQDTEKMLAVATLLVLTAVPAVLGQNPVHQLNPDLPVGK